MTITESSAVNANGTPLDVKGWDKTEGLNGIFYLWTHVCDRAVNCLLGADFLKKHEAIIDCKSGKFSLEAYIYTE